MATGTARPPTPPLRAARRSSQRSASGRRQRATSSSSFPSASYDVDELRTAAIEAAAVASVVGCTTVGAFTSELQVPAGCVATPIAGGELSFGVCHVERDDEDLAASRAGPPRRPATASARRGYDSALIVLSDALTPDRRELARGAFEVTSAVVPMVGGAAGDDLRFEATTTFG